MYDTVFEHRNTVTYSYSVKWNRNKLVFDCTGDNVVNCNRIYVTSTKVI